MHPRTPLSLKNNFKKEANQDFTQQSRSCKPKIKVLGKIKLTYTTFTLENIKNIDLENHYKKDFEFLNDESKGNAEYIKSLKNALRDAIDHNESVY